MNGAGRSSMPQPTPMEHAEVLLVGGRAGVGKTTVGWEVSALLRSEAVAHAVIDGDFMGQVHPAPDGDPHRAEITEINLTAVWANFARRGYRRLIYTNTLSVLPAATGMFERAMGAGVGITRVLLTASDATARERLSGRELGSELEQELAGSVRKARLLDRQAPADTVRVATDGRLVVDIAREGGRRHRLGRASLRLRRPPPVQRSDTGDCMCRSGMWSSRRRARRREVPRMPFPAIPRRVKIGDAAAFAGTTPRAIRHYHAIGLLAEPERGGDDRRRYGYDDMIRLLWIRRMADAGIPLEDIHASFEAATDIGQSLARLEESLAAKAAAIEAQRAAVHRLREVGSPLGLLSPLVTDLLRELPPGALRSADLDTLLVTERVFGPLGAAAQAHRFIVLATHPALRAEEDRLAEAEAALDDTMAPDAPRVEDLAARRCAHETALAAAIERSGLEEALDALLDREDEHAGEEGAGARMSAMEAVGKMPYDFSPARVRYEERVIELLHPADQDGETAPPAC